MPPCPVDPPGRVPLRLAGCFAGLPALPVGGPVGAPSPGGTRRFPWRMAAEIGPPGEGARLAGPGLESVAAELGKTLGPLIQKAVGDAVGATEKRLSDRLEPLLRITVRRALAEPAGTSRSVRPPGALIRLCWHLEALFTSRYYEDLLFERTHRFQVEEVFLLDTKSLGLVSHASHDPVGYAAPRRIERTVRRIVRQLRGATAEEPLAALKLPACRIALAFKGALVVLVVVTRGTPDVLQLADLEFALRRVEERLQAAPALAPGELRPFLEDCLWIQAPAA